MSDEKEKQIEQLLYIAKQQNEQIACLTDLCKNSNTTIKEMSKSHDKAFTKAFIATLVSMVIAVALITGMWLVYENQFTYESSTTTNTVSAEGTEANAQYINGDYTTEGSDK